MTINTRIFTLFNSAFKKFWQLLCARPYLSILFFAFFVLWYRSLPNPLFSKPRSTILVDKNAELLGARIATDGQWRFPYTDEVNPKFAASILEFEDKRFFCHPGFDLLAFFRALGQNISAKKVESGGSTLTMQVIRLASGNPKRTFFEKIKEIFKATRLEVAFSKQKILALYAANAPFGGNVVGLETAVWRYYGKKSSELTWAEAATLAVLPNSPALIHPGRNRARLQEKRDRLLDRLAEAGHFSAEEAALAKLEPLPENPLDLPQIAPHLMDRLIAEGGAGNLYKVTLDEHLQKRCTEVLQRNQVALQGLGVYNSAILVLDVVKNEVVAYVGNTKAGENHGQSVDVIAAARSSGSILKPYLYSFALEESALTPAGLLEDVPTQFGTYAPQNYKYTYDGAIPADRALARSLNVPWVRFLQKYGVERFHFDLKQLGFSTLTYKPEHYGLSLILGGAEVNLLEVTSAYAGMARVLSGFYKDEKEKTEAFASPSFLLEDQEQSPQTHNLSAGVVWSTFEAMLQVERPNELGEWELFSSSRQIAWKTGTSFGYRDAWAAGVTPNYAVGVWCGNADGEGRAGLVGVQSAAPILFEIFDLLPVVPWFEQPFDDMRYVPVCKHSGYLATEQCEVDSIWLPKPSLRTPPCSFCTILHLDPSGTFQVNSGCISPSEMRHENWFVLPTVAEYYFKRKNTLYKSPPPFRNDCLEDASGKAQAAMRLIYPKSRAQIKIPKELDGQLGKAVFEAAHRRPKAIIYWHLDEKYLGETQITHQMGIQTSQGPHQIVLVDELGERVALDFLVVD